MVSVTLGEQHLRKDEMLVKPFLLSFALFNNFNEIRDLWASKETQLVLRTVL